MASSPSSDSPPPPLASPPPVPGVPGGPPPSSAPPPDSGANAAPPPVVLSPPPGPNVPPPTPSSATPPLPSVSPPSPVLVPPVSSPPPPALSPPPPNSSPPPIPPVGESPPPPNSSPPPIPPVGESPPPPIGSPPPRSPSTPVGAPPPTALPPPPPKSTPPSTRSPPPPSPDPPTVSPPPPKSSPKPPVGSPPPSPPNFTPPVTSPPPPVAKPPRSSPFRPPAPPPPPPEDSPPTPSGEPPPPVPDSAPPPSVIPGTSPPVVQIPPSSPPSPPGPSKTAPSSPGVSGNKSGSDSQNVTIVIGVVTGVVILSLIALIAYWMCKRKKRSSVANNGSVIPGSMGSSPRSENQLVRADQSTSNFGGSYGTDTSNDRGGYGHSRSWFTYRELAEATGGFSDENLLGEGGFGSVYKGHLVDGRVVAVKQLKIGGGQGEREFKAEVEIISRIHHRHLVSLVGYCIWESKRLLVYDYVPNNTLHFHLHGEGRPAMDWGTRVKIAVGAARGIAYLHEDCHPRVIHRDIKSANILIDNNYEAQVSDFGLAKLAMDADTHISTRVMGTFGYMAPEYATTGKLTDKSDVFSFGVVLLELITGRKPVDASKSPGDESLVQWARPLLSHAIGTGEFDGLVDPRLEKNYSESEMFRMIEAAAACVRHSSSKRPKMGQVVRALGEYDSGDLTNGLKVGESQLYNSAQQSADIRWFRRMAFGSQDSSSDAFSQPTQSSGISTYSRPDMYFSAQPMRGGNSRQFSQESQIPLISGQREINVDIPGESIPDVHISRHTDHTAYHSTDQGAISRQLSLESQNPNISGQQEINVNIPEENKPDVHNSRQTDQTAYHSTNQGSENV